MDPKNKEQSGPSGILEMNPEGLHELDGAILDHESYERHTQHIPDDEAAAPAARPQPVFAAEPVHTGWQDTPDGKKYPVMGLPAVCADIGAECTYVTEMIPIGSGSYPSSFMTSYLSSFTYTSGSFSPFLPISSSGAAVSSAAGVFALGGYGLELI